MEALVILIAELVFAPAIAAASVTLELVATVLSVVFELLFGWLGVAGRGKTQEITMSVASKPDTAGLLRKVRNGMLILAGLIFGSLLLVNYLFLDHVMEWAAGKIEQRSGIMLSYSGFDGDLFAGRLNFSTLHARRENDAHLNFDINIKSLNLNMRMLFNPFADVQLDRVKIEGVTGGIQRLKSRDSYHERKAFVIRHLEISNSELNYKDTTPPGREQDLKLVIHDWTSSPLRSHYALFDLLFRSNAHGSVNSGEFAIESAGNGSSRQTRWVVDDVPVGMLRDFVGGPFGLLESGSVTVKVDDRWSLDDSPEINFAWHFTFSKLRAALPEDYTGLKREFARPVVDYLNTRPPQFDLGVAMRMDKDAFMGKSTLAASGLWRVMRNTLVEHLSKLSGEKKPQVEHRIKQGLDRMIQYLNKKRKGRPATNAVE